MDLDDTLVIASPEGLEFRLVLAGLGSRFIAGGADLIIQGIFAVILAVVTLSLGGLLLVVGVIGQFVILLLYPILFEVLAGGRTPGKRMTHLRVLRDDGSPIDLQASSIRNLVRLVDGPALLYLPTLVSLVATRRNQRPGDLAAGTIVVREAHTPRRSRRAGRSGDAPPPPAARERYGLEASAVTAQELAAVRRFMQRRESLEPAARRELARRLASGLRDKVISAPPELVGEAFLEALVEERSDQRQ